MDGINIGGLCAICLMDTQPYCSIYERVILYDVLVYEIINDVCQLDIAMETENDQFICSECYSKLLMFNSFKREAHKARAIYLRMKEDSEKIETDVDEDFVLKLEDESTDEDENNEQDKLKEVTSLPMMNEVVVQLDGESTKVCDITHPDNQEVMSKSLTLRTMKGKCEGADKKESEDIAFGTNVPEERTALIKDLGVHSGEKTFECIHCETRCKGMVALIRHRRIHESEINFECGKLRKRFYERIAGVHLRKHSEEKAFKCQHCEKIFFKNSDLVCHMRTHAEESPFECNVCSRRFPLKYCLVNHLRLHTGEAPYECSKCWMTFSQKGALSHHFRTHRVERIYQCERCEKSFTQMSALVQHSNMHSEVFKCHHLVKDSFKRVL